MRTRIKIICALLFCCSFHLRAQTYGWVVAAKLPHPLTTLVFLDSLHGWTADNYTGFYYTTDGGANWQQGSGATTVPQQISMYNLSSGWAAGWNGSIGGIYKTTNGGVSWIEERYLLNRNYWGTAALSLQKNVTSGQTNWNSSSLDTGKIVVTTDGGITWNERTPLDSASGFSKIQFLDSLNGFIWGYPRLRTRDGGKTWSQLPQSGSIVVFTFLDTLHGWGGYDWLLYKTTDGGISWQFQTEIRDDTEPGVGPEVYFNALSFLDSLNGWAFGDIFYHGIISEAIYRTTDGGNTWNRESVGLTPDFGSAMDGKMLDRYHGWAVCGDGSVLRYQLVTGVAEKLPEAPKTFSLSQNYPNPFNPTTTIEYEITHRDYVSLKVYDITGKEVVTLVNQMQEPGRYRVSFNGSSFSSGVYYYTLKTKIFTATKQMLLIK